MQKLPKQEATSWIALDDNEWEIIRYKPVMTLLEFAYCSIGAMIPSQRCDGSIIEEITKAVTAKTERDLELAGREPDWRSHESNIHTEASGLMDDFIKTVSERGDVLRNNAIAGELGESIPNPDNASEPYYKTKNLIEFARANEWELPQQLFAELASLIVEHGEASTEQSAPAAKEKDTTPADWCVQARAIADECFDHDTNARPPVRDSLATKNNSGHITGGYAFRVMALMQERDIKGARGIITNPATIMREALQGKKWWANKNK